MLQRFYNYVDIVSVLSGILTLTAVKFITQRERGSFVMLVRATFVTTGLVLAYFALAGGKDALGALVL